MKNNNKKDKFNEKRNICTHLYSNHYADYDNVVKYFLYDQINLAYPKKFIRVSFTYSAIVDIDPYIIVLLEIIKDYNGSNLLGYIHKITKTNKDILEYALADFIKNGFIIEKNKNYIISAHGLELIKKRKTRQIFQDRVDIEYDMVQNQISNIYESNSRPKVQRMDNNIDVEIQVKQLFRPDKYALDIEMPNGILYRNVLTKELQKFYAGRKENSIDITIESIDEIEVFNDKTYTFYYTLFFTNSDGENKLLVIDDKNEIDEDASEFLNELEKEGLINLNFSRNKNKEISSEKHEEKQEQIVEILQNNGVDTTKNCVIQNEAHPYYLIEAFKTAVSNIYIVSPWVRNKVLEKYKEYMESALKNGVNIYINYGISNNGKEDIDKDAKIYLTELSKKYKNLHIHSKANTHAKVLICDDKWVVTGSFNWLSYDGSDNRNESSTLQIDKNIIDILKQQVKI